MYPKLIKALPISPLTLELEYDNGERRVINLIKFCKTKYFKQLEDWDYFKKVEVKADVVVWPNEQDIAPETLYLESSKIN